MAALTADKVTRRLAQRQAIAMTVPVAATEVIFMGSLVSVKNGLGTPAVASDAGDYCLVAIEYKSNAAGAAAAVTVNCERDSIYEFTFDVADLGRADIGATVYAVDDQTASKTSGTNTPIGKIFRLDDDYVEGSCGIAWVLVEGEMASI